MSDSTDQNFADSAKNTQAATATSYFDDPELDKATAKIIAIARQEGAPKAIAAANLELVAELRRVKKQQIYSGERNDVGKSVVHSFEHYIKKLRRFLINESGGHAGDAYKRVKEAVVFEKLEDCGVPTLPVRRSQLHKLGTVDEEGQLAVWSASLGVAPAADITPKIIATAAIELGYTDVKLPGPTAAESKKSMREDWAIFKQETNARFGEEIRPFFARMDRHLAIVDKSKAPETGVEPPTDAPSPAHSPTAGGTPKATTQPNSTPIPVTPGTSLGPSSQDSHPKLTNVPELAVTVGQDGKSILLKFENEAQKNAVRGKLNFFALGYRWDDPSRSWRRRIDDDASRQKQLEQITVDFRKAGVLVKST